MTEGYNRKYRGPSITNPGNIYPEGVLSLSDPNTFIFGSGDNLALKPTKEYKYKEPEILGEMQAYIDRTYGEHYKKEKLECLDAWIARGTASSTCIDTAEKYLWRYGSKKGKNKDDLMKAMHYIMLAFYIDNYMKRG